MNIHVRMNFKQNDYIPIEHFDEIFSLVCSVMP